MIKSEKSEFSFIDFKINDCYLDFSKDKGTELNVNFQPHGKLF